MRIKKATTKILSLSKQYWMASVDQHFCSISEIYLLDKESSIQRKALQEPFPGNVQENISAQREADNLQQHSRDGRSRGHLGNYSDFMHQIDWRLALPVCDKLWTTVLLSCLPKQWMWALGPEGQGCTWDSYWVLWPRRRVTSQQHVPSLCQSCRRQAAVNVTVQKQMFSNTNISRH